MANINEQVNTRIKELRKKAGLTQEELAFNSGIHVSFISEIERGLKNPSIESLDKLLIALNISFKDFFDFETNAVEIKGNSVLNKLINDLHNRPEKEIEYIYGITKQFISYEDSRN